MADRRHSFSAFDAWVIDVLASGLIGVIAMLVLAALYGSLVPQVEGAEPGGAVVVLLPLLWIGSLVLLRKARAKRDVSPARGAK